MFWALATVHAAYPTLSTAPAASRRRLTLASKGATGWLGQWPAGH